MIQRAHAELTRSEDHAAIDVVVFGAGGHGKVVADVVESQNGKYRVIGFLDDRAELQGREISGRQVIGNFIDWIERMPADSGALIIGVGDNRARMRIAHEAGKSGIEFCSAVHTSASIGSGVQIGAGSVLMANTVVNADAVISEHVIINTSASVDHDCVINDFAHISPGANLAGEVTVGTGAHIGIGACVVPGVQIGEWATVGAGATVICDVPSNTTVVGTPAVPIEQRSSAR